MHCNVVLNVKDATTLTKQFSEKRVRFDLFIATFLPVLPTHSQIFAVQVPDPMNVEKDLWNQPRQLFEILRKCKYCPRRNPKIPSWDSWVVECDMFTPRYLVLLTFLTAHYSTCNVSFCPLLQIRTDLVGHELGNSGCQIQINDHFLLPSHDTLTHPSLKTGAVAAKTEKSI